MGLRGVTMPGDRPLAEGATVAWCGGEGWTSLVVVAVVGSPQWRGLSGDGGGVPMVLVVRSQW